MTLIFKTTASSDIGDEDCCPMGSNQAQSDGYLRFLDSATSEFKVCNFTKKKKKNPNFNTFNTAFFYHF